MENINQTNNSEQDTIKEIIIKQNKQLIKSNITQLIDLLNNIIINGNIINNSECSLLKMFKLD